MGDNEQQNELVRRMTRAMRVADQAFEQVGGSTRDHVRDCLLPVLAENGLVLSLKPLTSDRDIPLMLEAPGKIPTITCERWCKWYTLFVVHPDGKVEPLHYDALPAPPGELAYADHVPNPRAVDLYAESIGGAVDWCAAEMIAGRWQLEVVEQ